MTTFDCDDDIRRDEMDELHGIVGDGWHFRPPSTPKVDVRHPWTEADTYRAIALFAVDFTLDEVASFLGRTPNAVATHFSKRVGLKPEKLRGALR